MLCSEFNFEPITCTHITKGKDFDRPLTYTNDDGSAGDLTSQTLQLIMKDGLSGSTLLTLNHVGDNLTTGFYIPTPTNGIVNMQLTDTTTAGLTVGVYPYEITRTDSDSKVFIWMQGTIEVFDRGF